MSEYIDAKSFDDFKKNQERLIDIFNHNVTQISEDVREIKKDVAETKKDIVETKVELGELRGKTAIQGKLLWWIIGLIGSIILAAIFGTL